MSNIQRHRPSKRQINIVVREHAGEIRREIAHQYNVWNRWFINNTGVEPTSAEKKTSLSQIRKDVIDGYIYNPTDEDRELMNEVAESEAEEANDSKQVEQLIAERMALGNALAETFGGLSHIDYQLRLLEGEQADAYIDESDAIIHKQIEEDLAKIHRNTHDEPYHRLNLNPTGRVFYKRPHSPTHRGYNPDEPIAEVLPGPAYYEPTSHYVPPPNGGHTPAYRPANGWPTPAYNPADEFAKWKKAKK
jgi:hypothetical protein